MIIKKTALELYFGNNGSREVSGIKIKTKTKSIKIQEQKFERG